MPVASKHPKVETLIVKLFNYAADRHGRVSVEQGAKYANSSLGDARRDLEVLARERFLRYAGHDYKIPKPEEYTGDVPELVRYARSLIEKRRKERKEKSGKEPVAHAAEKAPAPERYPKRSDVDHAIRYMRERRENMGANHAATHEDLIGEGVAEKTVDFMWERSLLASENGTEGPFIITGRADDLYVGRLHWSALTHQPAAA